MPALQARTKSMKMPELRQKAKALCIKPGKMKKAELIHAIQVAEGYIPCFGRSNGQCLQTDCCFMEDCLKVRLGMLLSPSV
ncbi:MAG: Rho termination factor N-terminal domain-containing protein [Phycisphaerae bacterium]